MTDPQDRMNEIIDEQSEESFPASDAPSSTPVTGTFDRPHEQPSANGRSSETKIGFGLFGEEHGPSKLVRLAQVAEDAGFDFLMASDHYHPWTTQQGQSPFVWSVLGGIASVTRSIPVGTGVTCPTMRMHPAVVAQAAATTAAMMPGRFTLGVGSGEALNEHITGEHWPTVGIRQARLREAIMIIRGLWSGEEFTHHGEYFTVETARLFTRPETPPALVVAAAGPDAAELAAENDGLVVTGPSTSLIEPTKKSGANKPVYGQITLCWDEDEGRARETALQQWPISAIPWSLRGNLATPEEMEAATEYVPVDELAKKIICTSSPDPILDAIRTYAEAGVNHIYVHQIGPRQEAFIDFFRQHLEPELKHALTAAAA